MLTIEAMEKRTKYVLFCIQAMRDNDYGQIYLCMYSVVHCILLSLSFSILHVRHSPAEVTQSLKSHLLTKIVYKVNVM